MGNAKKHKTKAKNGTYNNDTFCTIVGGIQLIFCELLKMQLSDSLLQAIFTMINLQFTMVPLS